MSEEKLFSAGGRSIRLAADSGFCFGVSNAVEAVGKRLAELAEEGGKLYCLGQLIHNKEVLKELAEEGLVSVKDISEVPDGAELVIRAHGEPRSTYEAAAARGIRLLDETCPFVAKIHRIASEAAACGRYTAVIGDASHPEVVGILGSTPFPAGAVYSAEEAERLALSFSGKPLSVVAQTTISAEKFEECAAVLRQASADIEIVNTICKASSLRQKGALSLASRSDIMLVLGDASSSNSLKLLEICKKTCENALFIEKSDDLPLHELIKYDKIGVAASASAPERIIKEVIATMSEVFTKNPNEEMNEMAAYMDEIEKSLKLPGRGEVVTGTVVQVTPEYAVVNLGCKKDGMLPKEEVPLEEGQSLPDLFAEGDEVQVKVVKSDDGDGNLLLSRKRMQSGENWDEITVALDSKEILNVTVVKEVKGGVIAVYKEVSGFIPMSQLADRYVESAAEFVGKTLPVKVTRVDQRRNKAVFSHKAFLNEEKRKKIAEIWDTLNVGDVVEGKVMRFTDYGAFVDIGGIDGLLHISEISWGKLRHPQEALEIGQVVNVKILSMNAEKGKISLGMKQNQPEPWSVIDEQYSEGDIVKGKVVQIKEYGAFVELSPGLDGLVHISELAHKRVNKVSDELSIGQEIEIKILEIDKEARRISLSVKETLEPGAERESAAEEPAAEEAPVEEAVPEEPAAEEAPAEEAVAVEPAAEEAPAEEAVPEEPAAEEDPAEEAVAEEPAAEEAPAEEAVPEEPAAEETPAEEAAPEEPAAEEAPAEEAVAEEPAVEEAPAEEAVAEEAAAEEAPAEEAVAEEPAAEEAPAEEAAPEEPAAEEAPAEGKTSAEA